MRADAARLDGVLRALETLAVVLVHGGETDQVRATADRIVCHEAGSLADAFAVTTCDADDLDGVRAALLSPAFTARRRVVRVRDGGERLAAIVAAAIPAGALLVIDSSTLGARSKLLASVEAAAQGCVVTCTMRAAEASVVVRGVMESLGLRASDEAVDLLVVQARSGAGSLEMLALRAACYAIGHGMVDAAMVRELVRDPPPERLDAAVLEAFAQRAAPIDVAIAASRDEGLSGIALLRMAGQTVHRQRSRGGRTAEAAEQAAAALTQAERSAKSTGMPVDLVGRMAVLALAVGPVRYPDFSSVRSPSS